MYTCHWAARRERFNHVSVQKHKKDSSRGVWREKCLFNTSLWLKNDLLEYYNRLSYSGTSLISLVGFNGVLLRLVFVVEVSLTIKLFSLSRKPLLKNHCWKLGLVVNKFIIILHYNMMIQSPERHLCLVVLKPPVSAVRLSTAKPWAHTLSYWQSRHIYFNSDSCLLPLRCFH